MANNLVFNNVASRLAVLAYGIDNIGDSHPLLTDASGALQVSIQNDSVSVTGTVSVNGTVPVTGDLSITGTIPVTGTVEVTSGSVAITNAPTVNINNTVSVTGTVQVASGSIDIINTPSVNVANTVPVTGEVKVTELTQGTVTVSGGTIAVSSGTVNIGYTTVSSTISVTAASGTGVTLVQDVSKLDEYSYFVYNKGSNPVILHIEVSPTNVSGNYTGYDQATVTVAGGSSAVVIPSTIYGNYARLAYNAGLLPVTFDVYYVGR